MTKDEALKLALEALEDLGMKHFENTGEVLYKETFTAIKEALAQPEPNYKKALEVWLDKTEWVQETVKPHELGMHRADVLKQRIKEVLAQPEQDSCYGYKGKCNRVMSDGNPCGLNAPCPDCGLSLIDCPKPQPWEKFCDSSCVWTDHHPDCKLAQTEPVAWMFQHEETGRMMFVEAQQLEWGFEKGNPRLKKIRPVYTTPQQRTWVGLTDEEREEIALEVPMDAVLITEAKLKEKNT